MLNDVLEITLVTLFHNDPLRVVLDSVIDHFYYMFIAKLFIVVDFKLLLLEDFLIV